MRPLANDAFTVTVREMALTMPTITQPGTGILIAILVAHDAIPAPRVVHKLARVPRVAAPDLEQAQGVVRNRTNKKAKTSWRATNTPATCLLHGCVINT